MSVSTPSVSDVLKAIDIYMRLAYGEAPPSAVRDRLHTLHSLAEENFFASDVFERDTPADPSRWSVRLGNRHYPHMKLCIDPRPDNHGFVFRVNTHDKHCCPPQGSREYGEFCALMQKNQDLSQAIEAAWTATGLMTFKSYLRADLARRAAQ